MREGTFLDNLLLSLRSQVYIQQEYCAFKQLGKLDDDVMCLEASDRFIDNIWVH